MLGIVSFENVPLPKTKMRKSMMLLDSKFQLQNAALVVWRPTENSSIVT